MNDFILNINTKMAPHMFPNCLFAILYIIPNCKHLVFFSFQADLILLIHKWFPCCYCCRGLLIRTYSLSNYDSIIYRRNTTFRRGSVQNSSATLGTWQRLKPLNYHLSIMRKDNKETTGFKRTNSERPRIQTNGVTNGRIYTFRSSVKPSSPLFNNSEAPD